MGWGHRGLVMVMVTLLRRGVMWRHAETLPDTSRVSLVVIMDATL